MQSSTNSRRGLSPSVSLTLPNPDMRSQLKYCKTCVNSAVASERHIVAKLLKRSRSCLTSHLEYVSPQLLYRGTEERCSPLRIDSHVCPSEKSHLRCEIARLITPLKHVITYRYLTVQTFQNLCKNSLNITLWR